MTNGYVDVVVCPICLTTHHKKEDPKNVPNDVTDVLMIKFPSKSVSVISEMTLDLCSECLTEFN